MAILDDKAGDQREPPITSAIFPSSFLDIVFLLFLYFKSDDDLAELAAPLEIPCTSTISSKVKTRSMSGLSESTNGMRTDRPGFRVRW